MNLNHSKKKVSLYVHIPFCKQKCLYCDFTSYSLKENMMIDYVKALSKEIQSVTKNKIINTIFIGGGTPTYLSLDALVLLKESLDKVEKTVDVEFTVEGNPGTFTKEKLQVLKSMGVNRLSIGLQCFDDNMLKTLGRIHTVQDFLESYKLARNIGIKNINIDLMFGLPNQNLEKWKHTLKSTVELNPEHLSCYSLIIEEGTAFYKLNENNKLKLPKEEEERQMYEYCIEYLKNKGYYQYEISNFSKHKRQCRHNLVYWDLKEYIGCGVAAHSYIDGYRYNNEECIQKYIKCINKGDMPKINMYKNEQKDEIEEFMFMGLRKTNGISILEFKKRFKKDISYFYEKELNKYLKNGLIIKEKDRIYLSKEAINISNSILADFILT